MATCLYGTAHGVATVQTPLERVRLGKRQLLLKLIGTTICEADRRATTGSKRIEDRPISCVLGHEGFAQVIGAGRDAQVEVGDHVVVMPHWIPDSQRRTAAFERGEIYKLHTRHAGMHVDGTMATHMVWDDEWVRRVAPSTIERTRRVTGPSGVHSSAVIAETEHLGCVLTAFDLMRTAEKAWNGKNWGRLRRGQGRVAIIGGGWMGWLAVIEASRRFPGAEIWIRDAQLQREQLLRQLARDVLRIELRPLQPLDPTLQGTFDLTVMATYARSVAPQLFELSRPGGHVMLFSGIHNGAVDLVFDPAKLTDLERIHRDGVHTMLYRTAEHFTDERVIASGSSGYSVACFERAVRTIADYAPAIAAGVGGVVQGMLSPQLDSTRAWAPSLVRQGGGPVMEQLFQPDWPGRLDHLKIVLHPNVDDEIRDFYRGSTGKEGR